MLLRPTMAGQKNLKNIEENFYFYFCCGNWMDIDCVVAYLISKLKILLPHMESEMLMIIICAVQRFSSASFILIVSLHMSYHLRQACLLLKKSIENVQR